MCLLVNFAFQVLLVRQDVSVPFGDSLLLTNPNFLRHLEGKGRNGKMETVLLQEQKATRGAFPKTLVRLWL